MTRRLIIHCGLHKTGSKAVQAFLHEAAATLRAHGLLVPRAGRMAKYGHGHHNIAWELTRDRRFEHDQGTVAELAAEIAAFDGDAVISSEDFETCFAYPQQLLPLLRHPALAGRKIELLIYLRDQISYAESLYLEKLRHGVGDECVHVMASVLLSGEWLLREWRFQFDYGRLLDRLGEIGPLQLVLRHYVPPSSGGIVADLLPLLRPGLERAALPAEPRIANPRLTLAEALAAFLGNRYGALGPRELAAVTALAMPVHDRTPLLPPAIRASFAARFAPGNAALCQAAGLAPGALDLTTQVDLPTRHAVFMDCLLSFETQHAFARLRGLLPDRMDFARPDISLLSPVAIDLVRRTVTDWLTQRSFPG